MADENFVPQAYTTGSSLTPSRMTSIEKEIDDQEAKDAAQDASRTGDLTTQDTRDDGQDAAIAGKVASSTRTADLATQDSRDDGQDAAIAAKGDAAAQDARDDTQETNIAANTAAAATGVSKDAEQDARLDFTKRWPRVQLLKAGGFTTIPQYLMGINHTPLVPRALHLTHFVAERTETLTKIHLRSGQNGAQGNTATLIRMGVWEVVTGYDSSNPNDRYYVRIATTPNNPDLLDAPFELTADQTLSAQFIPTIGHEYAWGILDYQDPGTETHYVCGIPNISYQDWAEPRYTGAIYELTDLPADPIKLEDWQATHLGIPYARFKP